MMDTMIEGVEDGNVWLNDEVTIAECMTLVSNRGKIEAIEGRNDDAAIALAIALQVALEERKDQDLFSSTESMVYI